MSNRVWWLMALLTLLWAASFPFYKVLIGYLNPYTLVFYRVFFAAAILLAFIALQKEKIELKFVDFLAISVMGLLNNALPFTLIAFGIEHITANLASVLNATTGIFGVIVAAIFFMDEKLRLNKVLGVMIGFIGVIIVMDLGLTDLDGLIWPKVMLILSSLSYALAGVWAKSKLNHIRFDVIATGQLISASLLMLPLAIANDPFELFQLDYGVMGAMLGLAIISTAMAYPLYFIVIKEGGVGIAKLITITIPPVSIAMNSYFLGEVIGINEMIGGVIIITGLIIIDGRLFIELKQKLLK